MITNINYLDCGRLKSAMNSRRVADMSDKPTARDTAALVDLMYDVMRRIWDHAEERLAPYSLSLKHNWALHALDEPMSMSALADRMGIDASYVTTIADQLEERRARSSASRIRQTAGSRAWRSRRRADGSGRSWRMSSGSRCRSSMRSRPPNDESSRGCSRGPSTQDREADGARRWHASTAADRAVVLPRCPRRLGHHLSAQIRPLDGAPVRDDQRSPALTGDV